MPTRLHPTVIDIETGPLDEIDLKAQMPEFMADVRLKDPAKIAADLAEKQKSWTDKAALSATTGRVLAVGLLMESHSVILEGDEPDILADTWRHWSETGPATWIGHNILGFDMPFLLRRSWVHGRPVPLDVWEGRYMTRRVVDTMVHWRCGDYRAENVSLDRLAKALHVGEKSGSGADFAARYKANRDEALLYIENDLRLTAAVAIKLGLMR